jgi:sulfatase modifying factor 1
VTLLLDCSIQEGEIAVADRPLGAPGAPVASSLWMANTWQGEFPVTDTGQDGYQGTSPVGVYPANGHGLSDMIGNVWEWTADWYHAHPAPAHACCTPPPDRGQAASIDRHDPARIPRKVTKGGSHLCAPNYCRRYRPAARMPPPVGTSTSHLGFRCIIRPPGGGA